MPKYRITTLSPVHIGSGDEYVLNYNMLYQDGKVYIFDEFKIGEFFINNHIEIPSDIELLKKLIQDNAHQIINANIHDRVILSAFANLNKPVLTQVASQNNPILSGSSIKGSLRTSILNCLYNKANNGKTEHLPCDTIFENLANKHIDSKRFENYSGKNIEAFDRDFARIFRDLKVSDSNDSLLTSIVKTINIKKERTHQSNRKQKTDNLSNSVESINIGQMFTVDIEDAGEMDLFQNIGMIANTYYLSLLVNDCSAYFIDKDFCESLKEKLIKLGNEKFILNLGKYAGAELKSIEAIREIKLVKEQDKSTTTARTFALTKDIEDTTFFDGKLIPFGWVLVELEASIKPNQHTPIGINIENREEWQKRLEADLANPVRGIAGIIGDINGNARVYLNHKKEVVAKLEQHMKMLNIWQPEIPQTGKHDNYKITQKIIELKSKYL